MADRQRPRAPGRLSAALAPCPGRRRCGSGLRRVGWIASAVLLLLGSSVSYAAQPTGPRTEGTERQAMAPQSEAMTLEELLRVALEANPEIRAAVARVEAAAERPPQAGSLPDPMLTGIWRNVGFPRISLGDEMMSAAGVRVSQGIPYPGKRNLRSAVAERGIEVARAREELIRRRVLRELTEAYLELDFVLASADIVDQTRSYLEDLERTAEARYAVGQGIQQDVLKAQVQVSVLLNRLVMLEQQRDSVETTLNRLLNRPPAAAVGAPVAVEPPPWDLALDDLLKEAGRYSALLRERTAEVERQRASVDLAVRERLPDLQFSSAWTSRGGLPDMWEVNVGFTLPIWHARKQDRAVAEASAELRADEQDEASSRSMVAAAVRNQYLRADRAARLLGLFREAIIPQASLSLESAIAGYEVGRVDFLTVLDNVVTLLTYQIELERQQTDFLQAIARIEEHVGRTLGVMPDSVLEANPWTATKGESRFFPIFGGRPVPPVPARREEKEPGGER